ncbi:MAG: hypothetical protein U0802_12650 [Candidatus Binatia bacterium]
MSCAAVLTAGLIGAAAARGAGTDPTLALTAGEAIAGGSATMLRLQGSLAFDDQLQFAFPAGVIVFRGTPFVHIPVNGPPLSGTAALLADGLADTEVQTLIGLGAPAGAPARLASLQPSEVRVVLPAGFGSGPATAVVYAVLEGNGFLSNPIAVTLP